MALGACRGSGRSLIFLDTGELRALDAFTTPVFPVQGIQGVEGPQGSNSHTGRHSHTYLYLPALKPTTPIHFPKLATLHHGPFPVSLPQILAYNSPWLPIAQR